MISKIFISCGSGLLLLLCACASPKLVSMNHVAREISDFRAKHEEATKYIVLREANLDRYFDLYRIESANTQLILNSLNQQYGRNEPLRRRIDQIIATEARKLDRVKGDMLGLLNSVHQGSVLVEFEYGDDVDREWGFLILKSGNIVKREVWGFAPALLRAESIDTNSANTQE